MTESQSHSAIASLRGFPMYVGPLQRVPYNNRECVLTNAVLMSHSLSSLLLSWLRRQPNIIRSAVCMRLKECVRERAKVRKASTHLIIQYYENKYVSSVIVFHTTSKLQNLCVCHFVGWNRIFAATKFIINGIFVNETFSPSFGFPTFNVYICDCMRWLVVVGTGSKQWRYVIDMTGNVHWKYRTPITRFIQARNSHLARVLISGSIQKHNCRMTRWVIRGWGCGMRMVVR